jgi:long-chain-fatty-acid--[acyl-carrier-protein] ligase
MLNALLRLLLKALLSVRYRVKLVGVEAVAAKDARGMLFLPNHPALIDPLILLCYLTAYFPVRALADRKQIDRPLVRWLAQRINVRGIKNAQQDGDGSKHQIANTLRDTVRGLRQGEALVLYPAGRIYRQRHEDLRANSAVEFLVRTCPDIRVVLVRTTGLWGSGFGFGSGRAPNLLSAARRGIKGALMSGLLFTPKRSITIELHEPSDFPRTADKHTINRYLERFYNDGAPPNTYVPYSVWETGESRIVAEPDLADEGTAAKTSNTSG